MEFLEVKKLHEGKFISRYDAQYRLNDGTDKKYEFISRKKNIETLKDMHADSPDAVVIIATDESGEHILVNREYRMAVGEWVYNLPAGIIEPGEDPDSAAVRELKEETGLDLCEIEDHLPLSYSAVGFSNESNVCVIGKARGEFAKSTSAEEEIVPGWYDKKQIKQMLNEHRFTARCQAWCYLWSRE